ncbi:MAG: FAD-dependent oxidoreductase [Rubrivivax sp.]
MTTSFNVRLQRREEVACGTTAFHFDKPTGFAFKPGQAVDLILPNPPTADAANGRHAFSIVSAPFELELVVATRMRDSVFKNALKAMSIGSSAQLEGPFGSLTLHNNRARPAVFIAGGIGITPFMSILRQATKDQLEQALVLLYSNRRPEDSAFLVELQQLEQENKHFRLVATMTQMSQSKLRWQGETGLIDEAFMKRIGNELLAPIYYLAGPPAMVGALQSTLNRAGVNDDDIRSEEFYGY